MRKNKDEKRGANEVITAMKVRYIVQRNVCWYTFNKVRYTYMPLFCATNNRTVGLVCFHKNKRHQAVESPSHVHRSSVDYNCGRIYVSIERIAAIKKPEKTGKQNAMRVAFKVSTSNNLLCAIVPRSDFASTYEYCISSLSVK